MLTTSTIMISNRTRTTMPTTVRSSRRTASASASAWHARLILAVLALCLTGTAWIASATATTATQRHVSLASDEGFVSARSTLPSSIWATGSGGYNDARFESAVEDDERPESASFPQASLSFPAAPSKVSPQVSIGDDVNAVELDVLRQSVRSAISRGCSEVACSLLGKADTEQRQQPPTADSIVEIVPVARNSRGGFQLDLTPADKQYFRERYQYDVDELHALFAQSPEFTVDERALGEGSFGIVYSARRRRTGESKTELLAVKLLRMDTLVHVGHDVVMANKIIESMRGRPNDAEHLVLPRGMFWIVAGGQRRQLAMVFDHMDTDLLDYTNNRKNPRGIDFFRTVGAGLLGGLRALHARGIVHADVKPENVLYAAAKGDREAVARLADFGLSMSKRFLYYVQHSPHGTLQFMSPEQAFELPLNEKIDMWSVGVSLFIIATRINFYETKPRSPRELQHRLLRMLAVDSADAIRATVQLSPVLERTLTREDSITMRAFLHRKIVEEGVNVDLQRCKRVQLVDLLANLLTWSAADRLSAAEALRHPFFGRTCYGPRMADSHSFDAVDQFGRMSSTETDAGYQDPLRIYHGEPTQLAAQRARSLRSHAISIAESAAVLEGARAEDEYNNANYDGDDERNEGADNAQDEPPIVRRRGRFRYVLDDDLPVLGGRRRLSAVFDE